MNDLLLIMANQDGFKYNKVENVMIGLAVVHFFIVAVTSVLVYKVYKLIKFQDLPILLSIFSVFCSLLSNLVSF